MTPRPPPPPPLFSAIPSYEENMTTRLRNSKIIFFSAPMCLLHKNRKLIILKILSIKKEQKTNFYVYTIQKINVIERSFHIILSFRNFLNKFIYKFCISLLPLLPRLPPQIILSKVWVVSLRALHSAPPANVASLPYNRPGPSLFLFCS